MSEGTEVTFVNGHAESQTTEGEGTGIATDERDAAVAAVKAALKKEASEAGEKAAKEAKKADEQEPLRPRGNVERDIDGKFKKSGKVDGEGREVPEKEPEADAESLKRVLKERKQIAAQKQVQQEAFQKQAQQLQAFQRQLQQQQRELEQDRARLAQLRKDPIRAIKENGWDPESFILDLAQDGTPEGQERRRQKQLAEDLKEMQDWKAEQERQRNEYARRQKEAGAQQHRNNVEQNFASLALDEDKHPHLASFYKDNQKALRGLIQEGDDVADDYRELTGKEASLEEIVEYLEERRANWYKSRSGGSALGRISQGANSQAPVTKGRPTQGSATGRTLSPEDGSERRALGTSLKDLDGDERLAAAREAVGAALRASGEHR